MDLLAKNHYANLQFLLKFIAKETKEQSQLSHQANYRKIIQSLSFKDEKEFKIRCEKKSTEARFDKVYIFLYKNVERILREYKENLISSKSYLSYHLNQLVVLNYSEEFEGENSGPINKDKEIIKSEFPFLSHNYSSLYQLSEHFDPIADLDMFKLSLSFTTLIHKKPFTYSVRDLCHNISSILVKEKTHKFREVLQMREAELKESYAYNKIKDKNGNIHFLDLCYSNNYLDLICEKERYRWFDLEDEVNKQQIMQDALERFDDPYSDEAWDNIFNSLEK